jgi:GNAT superfamily N-acetyltransferase
MEGQQRRIRLAVDGDVEHVVAIDPLAAAGDQARASLLRRSVEEAECLVHEGQGTLNGFVIVKPQHFFGRDFVELLQVTRAMRRSGIGRALMEAAQALEGTTQLFTSTNRSNEPMRALLEQSGWYFSGELSGLDEGDPELVFFSWRTLSPSAVG